MKWTRTDIHNKFNGRCAYCGDRIDYISMQVDHIIPKYNFEWHISLKLKVPYFLSHLTIEDVNHIDNLFPSCRSCNKFKDIFCLDVFRSEIEAQVKRLRAAKPTLRLAERYGLIECTEKPVVFYFETFNTIA